MLECGEKVLQVAGLPRLAQRRTSNSNVAGPNTPTRGILYQVFGVLMQLSASLANYYSFQYHSFVPIIALRRTPIPLRDCYPQAQCYCVCFFSFLYVILFLKYISSTCLRVCVFCCCFQICQYRVTCSYVSPRRLRCRT